MVGSRIRFVGAWRAVRHGGRASYGAGVTIHRTFLESVSKSAFQPTILSTSINELTSSSMTFSLSVQVDGKLADRKLTRGETTKGARHPREFVGAKAAKSSRRVATITTGSIVEGRNATSRGLADLQC